jgi:hypothetical protein
MDRRIMEATEESIVPRLTQGGLEGNNLEYGTVFYWGSFMLRSYEGLHKEYEIEPKIRIHDIDTWSYVVSYSIPPG